MVNLTVLKSRTCGTCTMCCKLLGIKELDKPSDKWCPHCDVGHGCKIYADRPPSCVEFACAYIMEPDLPEELRPDRCRVVMWAPIEANDKFIQFNVDPAYPDAWKTSAMRTAIESILSYGSDIIISTGNHRAILTSSPARAEEYYLRSKEKHFG